MRAIGLGLLVPVVIAPVALVLMLAAGRLFPDATALALPFDAAGHLFGALIPESGYNGLLVPILLTVSPGILVGDLGAAFIAWRMLRSVRLAGVTLATAVLSQLVGAVAACVLLAIAW